MLGDKQQNRVPITPPGLADAMAREFGPELGVGASVARIVAEDAIQYRLTDRNAQILHVRLGCATHADAGRSLGITGSRVRDIYCRAQRAMDLEARLVMWEVRAGLPTEVHNT